MLTVEGQGGRKRHLVAEDSKGKGRVSIRKGARPVEVSLQNVCHCGLLLTTEGSKRFCITEPGQDTPFKGLPC